MEREAQIRSHRRTILKGDGVQSGALMDLKSGHGHSRCSGLQSWGPLCRPIAWDSCKDRYGRNFVFKFLLLKITYLFVLGLHCSLWDFFFCFLVAVCKI